MSLKSLKTITKVNLGLLFGISSLLLSNTLQAQNFYKWVDKDGSTHYTTTPPPANAKRLGNVATYDDTPRYTPPPPAETPATEVKEAESPPTETNDNNRIPIPPAQPAANQINN